MGYTHYWRGLSRVNPETYQSALQDVRKVLAALGGKICEQPEWKDGEPGPYTMPPTLEQGQDICINGAGGPEMHHETFWLPHDPAKVVNEDDALGDFQFCKTAEKPYDLAVTASLSVLAQYCPEVMVSSDGEPEDWKLGRFFARTILERDVPCPLEDD